MRWKNTTLKYVGATNDTLYGISGKDHMYLIESDYISETPRHAEILYAEGEPLSCLDWGHHIAVLTNDRKILKVNVEKRKCSHGISIPSSINPARILCVLDDERLLIADVDGNIFMMDGPNYDFSALSLLQLASPDAHVICLDQQLFLSGKNDEIILYDIVKGYSTILDIKASSIKGRAFRATITGDLSRVTSYGRLYSTGMPRQFIKWGQHSILGVYDGAKDAVHVFCFSEEYGCIDLGRPRVIKDSAEQLDLDTEWANIHYIARPLLITRTLITSV